MKSLAKLVFFQSIAKGLIQFLLIQLVNLEEKALHSIIGQFIRGLLSEDRQKFHLSDRIEGVNRVLS